MGFSLCSYLGNNIMIDKNFKFNHIQEKALERLRAVNAHVIALLI